MLGTTYSHRHAKAMGLDSTQAFADLLGLKFDIIRLCCYWDEIQPREHIFDYSEISTLLDMCEKIGQDVVVTIGMKAPRWPEFYIPTWAATKSIADLLPSVSPFIANTIKALCTYSCITHWQVENEPLDPSGPSRFTIPLHLLQEEVRIVRSIDPTRKILITLWGNHIQRRNTLTKALDLADIAGLDLYYKVTVFGPLYTGPKSSDAYYQVLIEASKKPLWITELQAEPWEKNELVARDFNPPSMNPHLLQSNFKRATWMKPKAILLWGYEYWHWRKQNGDTGLWRGVQNLQSRRSL